MNTKSDHIATYSLGWNFSSTLLEGIISLNNRYASAYRISEVYGALPDSPLPSARPKDRIPSISQENFKEQVRILTSAGIAFNFLMNTYCDVDLRLSKVLPTYLNHLLKLGIYRLTLGTPTLIRYVKNLFPEFHLTLSLTYGTKSLNQLQEAMEAGADAVYLDGVCINRDFKRLRKLLNFSRDKINIQLYANLSCISNCPVIRDHYMLFANFQNKLMSIVNDAFFAGCSLIKLKHPVEWIQTPWIRPEDISAYVREGIRHFKLSDRLAKSNILLQIAESYLKGISPEDIFVIIERGGAKYSLLKGVKNNPILKVDNSKIPGDFINHFLSGQCNSTNPSCDYCTAIAEQAVQFDHDVRKKSQITPEIIKYVPIKLLSRV